MGIFGWSRDEIPDLTGKVAVVTGADSGIGYETTRYLLEHNAEVVMASRNKDLLRQSARDLEEECPGCTIHTKDVDMKSLKSVKSLANDVLAMGKPIHILINNAGKFLDEPFYVTPEGFEHTLATNYFGHVYLTLLLMDRILSSGPSGRIVNVASIAEMYGQIDWDDLTGANAKTSGMPVYARSKLMLIMFSFELQRRLKLTGKKVDAFPVHPGEWSSGLMQPSNTGCLCVG